MTTEVLEINYKKNDENSRESSIKFNQLAIIYSIVLIDLTIAFIVIPILPEYTKNSSNPSFWLSFAAVLFISVQLFSAPLLGRLSDIFGRRPVFVFSAIGTLFSSLFLIHIKPLGLYANRFSDGFTNGMQSAVQSSITDVSDEKNLLSRIGFLEILVSIGLIVGPAIAGVITYFFTEEAARTQAIIYFALFLSLVNIILTLLFKETHRPQKSFSFKTLSNTVKWRELVPKYGKILQESSEMKRLVAIKLFLAMSLGYYSYYIVFLSTSRLAMSAQEISLFFLYVGVVNISVTAIYFRFLQSRFRKTSVVLFCSSMFALTHLLYAQTEDSLTFLYLVVTLDCLLVSPLVATVETMIAERTNEENRGQLIGLIEALSGFAGLFTTVVFTLMTFISVVAPFYWFAFCAASVACLSYWHYRTKKSHRIV